MGKQATKYFKTDTWNIIEDRYDIGRNQISESIFSLGNEYMGCRGTLEEGVGGSSLAGNYFNGIYEWADEEHGGYKGIVRRTHYMVNSVDFFKIKLLIDGEVFDQSKANISDYCRTLDMKSGALLRHLTVTTAKDRYVKLSFERFLDMTHCSRAYQRITIESNYSAHIDIELFLTFDVLHWGKPTRWTNISSNASGNEMSISASTFTTGQTVSSRSAIVSDCPAQPKNTVENKTVSCKYVFDIVPNSKVTFDKYICNCATCDNECDTSEMSSREIFYQRAEGFDVALERNKRYWDEFWNNSDITIVGDDDNQQGIRFCIFQLQQTYHGDSPTHNIGAKGLTGEAYSGHAFWDTETYCLPYYLLTDTEAARSLLLYRYNTLAQAKKRAIDLDCQGACYPIATLNGQEACNLWQHASLQIQPTTAVAYGIWHYVNITQDEGFLRQYGLEMLVEICRFLASRGQWNNSGRYFGYYAVMGPDEFQMMVNHNTYTNYMAKKTIDYTMQALESVRGSHITVLEDELKVWRNISDNMLILYDDETALFEQHQGYYDLPHIDIHSIPSEQFPLYHHWSYDRIYRNDMIKQPDVLMLMLLYNQDFSLRQKKANYDYYEPRTIHESSLSPSVHSILAQEIGYSKQALDFFSFATRMDLDDYNRNTCEGLHTTSISAAWLNIVYGFGGVRTDGKTLRIAPTKPDAWEQLSFTITYRTSKIKVTVQDKVTVRVTGDGLDIEIFNKIYSLEDGQTIICG